MYFGPEFKLPGVIALAAVNLGLLVWAVTLHVQKRSIPDGYYKWLTLSPLFAAIQVVLGVTLQSSSYAAPGMHIFYGVMVALGAGGQLALGARMALSQKYRARPLVYAFLNLFVLLLSLRSWMAA